MKKFFSKENIRILLGIYFAVILTLYLLGWFTPELYPAGESDFPNAGAALLSFNYAFDNPGLLYEADRMENSKSRYWWVNSGALLKIENGVGQTVQGELGPLNRWRLAYRFNNPQDTDNGSHPQNIFRLFTRGAWRDLDQQIYFKINKDNLSSSPNRDASNGVFLISRAKNGDNLYYAGVRVDGTAVIKKKRLGLYTTLAQKKIWDGNYDRQSNPSLLPKDEWLGLRNEVGTRSTGETEIRFFLDRSGHGNWEEIFDMADDGKEYGPAITGAGSAGLRSDFMDIEFRDFKITETGGNISLR